MRFFFIHQFLSRENWGHQKTFSFFYSLSDISLSNKAHGNFFSGKNPGQKFLKIDLFLMRNLAKFWTKNFWKKLKNYFQGKAQVKLLSKLMLNAIKLKIFSSQKSFSEFLCFEVKLAPKGVPRSTFLPLKLFLSRLSLKDSLRQISQT